MSADQIVGYIRVYSGAPPPPESLDQSPTGMFLAQRPITLAELTELMGCYDWPPAAPATPPVSP